MTAQEMIVRLSLDELQYLFLPKNHEPVEVNPYLDIALAIEANAQMGLLFINQEVAKPAMELVEVIKEQANTQGDSIDISDSIFKDLIAVKHLLAIHIRQEQEFGRLESATFYRGVQAVAAKLVLSPYDDINHIDTDDEDVAEILKELENHVPASVQVDALQGFDDISDEELQVFFSGAAQGKAQPSEAELASQLYEVLHRHLKM